MQQQNLRTLSLTLTEVSSQILHTQGKAGAERKIAAASLLRPPSGPVSEEQKSNPVSPEKMNQTIKSKSKTPSIVLSSTNNL